MIMDREDALQWFLIPFRIIRFMVENICSGLKELNCIVSHRQYYENDKGISYNNEYGRYHCNKCHRKWLDYA